MERRAVLLTLTCLMVLAAGLWLGSRKMALPPPPSRHLPPTPIAKRRARPPLFSQAYREATQGILDLEESDVRALEQRLARDPEDFSARLQLLAYSMRADRASLPESAPRRKQLLFWLLQHHPESEILASPYARTEAEDLTQDEEKTVRTLWGRALAAQPEAPRVLFHAALFYRSRDPLRSAELLEQAAARSEQDSEPARQLGLLYGEAVLSPDSTLGSRAVQTLDRTNNPRLLEAAIFVLQMRGSTHRIQGVPSNAGALARRYFSRAKQLDPELDEASLLPPLDPKLEGSMRPGAIPETPARAAVEPQQLRTLGPEDYPALPAPVAAALRQRGCRIPQPMAEGPPRNVIRGEFFASGEPAWAVLCSARGSSTILVFRGSGNEPPEELATAQDEGYFQDSGGGRYVYSREIATAGRQYIMRHYRAYGGPQPPPIRHEAIDDSFLEKASVTYYRHEGKWLPLQGAD